jgi:hypothetical protein
MESLTQNDTGFLLWCLGYVLGKTDKLDEAHKKFIEKGHASVLPKIAELHESFNKEQKS